MEHVFLLYYNFGTLLNTFISTTHESMKSLVSLNKLFLLKTCRGCTCSCHTAKSYNHLSLVSKTPLST